jgi:hypothetical protein
MTGPSGILTGSYSSIKAGRKFALTLDESSRLSFKSLLETRSDELCNLAPGSNTISSLRIGKFVAKLNKKQTKAKLTMKVSAIGSDGMGGDKVTYSLKAGTDFNAFGCGTRQPYKNNSWMNAVTASDLNADGAMDMVLTQTKQKLKISFSNINLNLSSEGVKYVVSSEVVIYLQDPFAAGVFRRQPDITVVPEKKVASAFRDLPSVAVGDLDGDGFYDIAVPKNSMNMIGVLPQDPGNPGAFLQPRDFPLSLAPVDVAIGDLNGDGINDMVVAGTHLSLLMNDPRSPGTVFDELTLEVGNVSSVAIADVDRDGRNDLAATTGNSVIVLLQDPVPAAPGSFTAGLPYASGSDAADVAIGDLNGDSLPDLAVANRGFIEGSVSVHMQDATRIGEFLPGVSYLTGRKSQRVKIHDLNNDGLPDLAIANNDSLGGSVSVLLQDTLVPGMFLESSNYPGLSGPDDVGTEDVNGDGLADLVVADKCRDYRERPYIRYQDSVNPGSFLSPAYLP